MAHPIAPFIKRFLGHFLPVQKGLSANTVQAYRDGIKLLLCYAAHTCHRPVDTLTIQDIGEKIVLGFLDHIEQQRGCSTRTRNTRLAALRCLFAYIAREEPLLIEHSQQIRAIPLKRTQHKTVTYLEEKDIQAVLDTVNVNARTGCRDRALLLVLYNTGARVSEVVNLTLADLHLDNAPQIKLRGKGNKERSCPLWPETAAALRAYIRQRIPNQPTTQQVFLNATADPITRFGIRHVTRKYGIQAQAKRRTCETAKPLNPHRIRHTTAMHLLRAGNDINLVSYWLGHADLNTTHIYVEIDMETKRKMLAKTHAPRIRRKPQWKRPSVLQWLQQIGRQPELCAAK
jgi:site-specific recombinase XerD